MFDNFYEWADDIDLTIYNCDYCNMQCRDLLFPFGDTSIVMCEKGWIKYFEDEVKNIELEEQKSPDYWLENQRRNKY